MGFMDKVKSVAQDAATQAKSATSQAQSKLDQTQTQKKMDGLAKQLGYAVYNERANGAPATGNDALVEEMKGLEAQIAALSQAPAATDAPQGTEAPVAHTDASSPPPSTTSSQPSSGDFKL